MASSYSVPSVGCWSLSRAATDRGSPDLHCGACGLPQRLAPEQVQPTLTCNDCDNETPLSLQVVIGARWRLKTRRLLTSKRQRSALPIAASLALLGQLQRRGDSANLHYALGLNLERDSVKFEI